MVCHPCLRVSKPDLNHRTLPLLLSIKYVRVPEDLRFLSLVQLLPASASHPKRLAFRGLFHQLWLINKTGWRYPVWRFRGFRVNAGPDSIFVLVLFIVVLVLFIVEIFVIIVVPYSACTHCHGYADEDSDCCNSSNKGIGQSGVA